MSDEVEVAVAERPHALHLRVRAGLRKPHNWVQLVKFCAVGASGYVVNLCVFALCVEALGLHHLVGATVAFVVAVTNNFWWNRHWTFKAGDGHLHVQWARFVVINVAVFLFSLVVLYLLIEHAGFARVPAQAIAVLAAAPPNFLGQKLWSFRD